MTTPDDFTEAARAEAEDYARTPRMNVGTVRDRIAEAHLAGIEWGREQALSQEPTDAECLAVLNVTIVPLGEPPKRNGLADWNPAAVERVRAALSAARQNEEKR